MGMAGRPMVIVVISGVDSPLIGKSSGSKGDLIEFQYTGAGYTTRKGFVHFNIDDDIPAPRVMSYE